MDVYITLVVDFYNGHTLDVFCNYTELEAYTVATNSALQILQSLGVSSPTSNVYQNYCVFLKYAVSTSISDLTYAMHEYNAIISGFVMRTDITVTKTTVNGTSPIIPTSVNSSPSTWNFSGIDYGALPIYDLSLKPLSKYKINCKSCKTDLYSDEQYCWKCGRKDPSK